MTTGCTLTLSQTSDGLRLLELSNEFLRVTVVPDKGADISSIISIAHQLDFLWKSPQGLRAPQGRWAPADSTTAWLEHYEGGWQEIFPNGGDACEYRGVTLNFHGESTLLPWHWTVLEQTPECVSVAFAVRLFRSPLNLVRRMTLRAGSRALVLNEQISNWSRVPIDLMWGHHPAFGAPFLSGQTRLFTNARSVLADSAYDAPHSPLVPGITSQWPHAARKGGGTIDLSHFPGPDEKRDLLAYLFNFDSDPWYVLANPALKVGIGLTWSASAFRCLWLWQESHAGESFPWYGEAYTAAVEPWSSYPGRGLTSVLAETQTQLQLPGYGALSADLTFCCFDLPAPDAEPTQVTAAGEVRFAEQSIGD